MGGGPISAIAAMAVGGFMTVEFKHCESARLVGGSVDTFHGIRTRAQTLLSTRLVHFTTPEKLEWFGTLRGRVGVLVSPTCYSTTRVVLLRVVDTHH